MIKSKEKNFVSAVIYMKNAEAKIAEFVETVHCELEKNFEKFEIICVDDCSQDQSVEKIREAVKTLEKANVSVLHMSFPHGREMCITAGVELAIGDFVFEFDSTDMDYNPEVIMEIYNTALMGCDIVSASSDGPRMLSSKFFYKVYNGFTNSPYPLKTESFRIISRRAINRISSMNKTIPYRKAVYANCGLKCESYYYESNAEKKKKSHKLARQEKRVRRALAIDSIILFTDAAYRFSIMMTIAMMGIMVLAAIYAMVVFVMGNPIAGWTTTILFLAFAFFGLFGILTIVIKYLSTIVDLIFKKQKYTFESIEKLTK